MPESLNKEERDYLLQTMNEVHGDLYPADDSQAPDDKQYFRLKEKFYQVKEEYADRLPRLILSRCPFTGEDLKRAIDPFGLDGPWWQVSNDVTYDEPQSPETFQVLLGAVDFLGRTPTEVKAQVKPGPGVPFVVPRLLDLPHMKAVIGSLKLATGDTAYPIAYFSDADIDPSQLHQSWCRNEYWFPTEGGGEGWSISNSIYDFDLAPYMQDGRLFWTDLNDPQGEVLGAGNKKCPFINLKGEKERQMVAGGQINLMGLPNGDTINPFDG